MRPLPTPQQLRYLLALAETQHVGRAAHHCGVTQSTLSAGIMQLERLLDARILDRDAGKNVVFTALGLDLVRHGRTALAALENVAEVADATRAPLGGPLRLGVIPTIGPFLLPRLMPMLRAQYPQLRLHLREELTARLVDWLSEARIDALLLALPCACGGAATVPLERDEFLAALPEAHPLAARARVPVAALARERLLLLEDGHCLRDQALAICGQHGLRQLEASEDYAATSLHMLVQMVASGLGITLLPRLAVAGGIAANLPIVLRPLSGVGAWRTIGLAWRPGAPRDEEYRALVPLIQAACAARATTDATVQSGS
jgi:LysR family transcriptional regulator, hydrogen peroxide-inducible genes activator